MTIAIRNDHDDHRLRLRLHGLPTDYPISHKGTPGWQRVIHAHGTFIAATLVRACGKLDVDGEPLEQTVVRELEEEIGRTAATVEYLIALHHSPGFCDEHQTVFLCTDLDPVPVRHDGPEEEHMIVKRFPLPVAVQMALDGTITDAKTIIGLLAAHHRLAG